MKRPTLMLCILMFSLLLAACAPGVESNPVTSPTPVISAPDDKGINPTLVAETPGDESVTSTPGAGSEQEEAVGRAAREALAERLQADVAAITVQKVEAVDWPDSCLGVANPAESCLAVITPGYRVLLDVDGASYQVNTNLDGSSWRIIENLDTGSSEPGTSEAALTAATEFLAQQLGVGPEAVDVLSVEAVDWPDGCLGVAASGQMCTEAITPGFQIVLDAGGQTYEFHTDEAGGVVYSAIAPLPEDAGKVLVWEMTEEGGVCSRIEVGSESVAYGPCGEVLKEIEFSRSDELAEYSSTFRSFSSATKAGTVQFTGQGDEEATPAEMRSVAEWARLIYSEAESGRSGAAWGLALAWHREGGIAGFCDDLAIYRTGWAVPSSCKGAQPRQFSAYRLSAEEIEQVFTWVDTLEPFETSQKDAGVADAMTVRVVFDGSGNTIASEEEQQEIANFAAGVYAAAVRATALR